MSANNNIAAAQLNRRLRPGHEVYVHPTRPKSPLIRPRVDTLDGIGVGGLVTEEDARTLTRPYWRFYPWTQVENIENAGAGVSAADYALVTLAVLSMAVLLGSILRAFLDGDL